MPQDPPCDPPAEGDQDATDEVREQRDKLESTEITDE